MTNSETAKSGEERLLSRRRAFWRFVVLAFLVALVGGFFGGIFVALSEDGSIPVWVPITLLSLAVVAFLWFTRDYYRRVDELDLLDNLWAHLWGMHFAITVFCVWYVLADLNLAAYPTALSVVAAMMIGTVGAYALRKLGLR